MVSDKPVGKFLKRHENAPADHKKPEQNDLVNFYSKLINFLNHQF